jgi:NAD(P)-dependent dehydrogenase (short-subunit alcohol dehydrogenase family)
VLDFSGKVVLVTGGGAGIGLATVSAFADLGAKDIAGCVLFLASPLAGWVSGTVLGVDGGSLAAAGWYRDDRGKWTNMLVINGNSVHPAD